MISNLFFPEHTYQPDATQNDTHAVEGLEFLNFPGHCLSGVRFVPLLSSTTVSGISARPTIIPCRWRRHNGVGHVATHVSPHNVQRMMESFKISLAAALAVLIVGDIVCHWARSL